MYRAIANVFLILIWISQFYSVVNLVFWINRNIADPRLGLRKIKTAMTVQIVILAGIVLFFAVDYVRNHAAGVAETAPSLRYYLANGAPYLIIPGIFLLMLAKKKNQLEQRGN